MMCMTANEIRTKQEACKERLNTLIKEVNAENKNEALKPKVDEMLSLADEINVLDTLYRKAVVNELTFKVSDLFN